MLRNYLITTWRNLIRNRSYALINLVGLGLDATIASIFNLLSKDFLKLVFITFVMATPIAYYVMSQFCRNN